MAEIRWDALAMHFREIPLTEDMRCGICRTGADLQASLSSGKEM